MNRAAKNSIKIVAFMLVFVLLFLLVQHVFIDKHLDALNYAQFYNEPRNSIDVISLGSSAARSSILPAVFWLESGITSYNLSGQSTPDAVSYYALRAALRRQSPAVVVIDGWYLFSDEGISENEARVRRAFDFMPLSSAKLESVSDVIDNAESWNYTDFIFPFFRYHNRRDLTRRDLDFSFRWQRSEVMHVYRLADTTYIPQVRPESFSDPDYADSYNIYGTYMTKIIELCKSEGIDVVIYMPPTCQYDVWSLQRNRELQGYADRHGVTLLDFNTDELRGAAGIYEATDFYNASHTNYSGGTKASRVLAGFLAENFGLEDRRGSGGSGSPEGSYDSHWDMVVEAYYERYNLLLWKIDNGAYRGSELDPDNIVDVDGDEG